MQYKILRCTINFFDEWMATARNSCGHRESGKHPGRHGQVFVKIKVIVALKPLAAAVAWTLPSAATTKKPLNPACRIPDRRNGAQ
jgi:hypothetical protein